MALGRVVSWFCILSMISVLHAEQYSDLREQERNIERRCHPPYTSCYPSQLEWAQLEHNMTGKLVWPEDRLNYTLYNYEYNLRTLKYSMVHAVCKTTQDIQHAVRFAEKHNLRVVVRATGRDYWGRSSAHGSLCINVQEMKHMHVTAAATDRSEHGEITVETGVPFQDIYEEVDRHARVVNGPYDPTICVGGYITMGAYGPLNRALGFGVDSVLEIKVVLADGRVATCTHNKTVIETDGSSETHNDGKLFWALRGGGGGTFGVIVHVVLKLYAAPPSIVYARFRVSYNHNDDLKAFLEANDKWIRTAPSHWGNFISFNNYPTNVTVQQSDTHAMTYNRRAFSLQYKLGPWDENVMSELKPFYDLQAFEPKVHVEVKLANYTSILEPLYFPLPHHLRVISAGAAIPPENHNKRLWDMLATEITHQSEGFKGCSTMRLGGNVSVYDETTSSVHPGYRRALGYVMCSFTAPGDHVIESLKLQETLETDITRLTTKLRKFGDGDNVFAGFVPDPDWKVVFWGEHYVELLKVKIRYDPGNLFSCYHCVGSDKTDFVDMFDSPRPDSSAKVRLSALMLLLVTAVTYMF